MRATDRPRKDSESVTFINAAIRFFIIRCGLLLWVGKIESS